MKTWFTHWKKGRGLDIESELKASRPEPSSHLVKSIAARVNPRPATAVPTRSRFALATAVIGTGVLVAAVGASGAFSNAASGLQSAARSVAQSVHIDSAPQPLTGNHSFGAGGANNGGQTSAAAQYLGAPTITKLNVSQGVVPIGNKAGTNVTVTGTNLGGITGLTVAGLDVMSYSNPSTSSITFQVPSTGTNVAGPVTVTNPAGSANSPGSFTVEVAPSTSVTLDNAANLEPGQVIHITGTGFLGVNLTGGSVKFNGKPAASVAVNNAGTTITATVPAGVQTGTLTVTNLGGTGSASYTAATGPVVNSFSPMSGTVGTPVKINGTGFSATDSITFGSSAAVTGTVNTTHTQLTVSVPGDATFGPVTVSDTVGTSSSKQNFTPIIAPSIASYSPNPGAGIGTVVTLTGTHFLGTKSVKFSGGTSGKTASFTVVSDTTIKATVPTGAIDGSITVSNAAGSDSSNTAGFVVEPVPTIDATGISPSSGLVVGDVIAITGTHFIHTDTVDPTVLFGKISATPISFTATTIHVNVPNGATTGKLQVVTAGGKSANSTQTVTIGSPPTVGAFPASQIANGTQTIVIHGTHFLDSDSGASTTVAFTNCAAAAPNAGFTDTSMTVTVPACAQVGKITVTTNAGSTQSKGNFTPVEAPLPTALWPNRTDNGHGAQKIGGTLTISGSRLSGASLVTFQQNGSIKPFTAKPKVISDGVITVTVPPGAANGTITVTTSVGTTVAGTGTIANFDVLSKPTISSLGAGPYTGGGTLTVNGANFINTNDLPVTVKIGTAACTNVNVAAGNASLTCTIPTSLSGKNNLAVTVSTEAGTSAPSTTKINVA